MPPDTNTTYSDATTSASGLMTPDMVTKLNGIDAGANKIIIDNTLSDSSSNPVANNVINRALLNHKHTVSNISDFPSSLPANGGNADTLGGFTPDSYVQQYHFTTDATILNDPTHRCSYETTIDGDVASLIGLPSVWWHIKFMKHAIADGYGFQIAFPLNTPNVTPMYRISLGTTWQNWIKFNDGGNADTLGGFDSATFVQQHLVTTSADLVNTANLRYSYETVIAGDVASLVGLPSAWWHLKYMRHGYEGGYGFQMAFPLDSRNESPKYRMSIGTTWLNWTNFNDGGNANNADTVDGLHSRDIFRYHDYGNTETDINQLIETGIYRCTTFVNYPPDHGDSQGTVIVISYTSCNEVGVTNTNQWLTRIFISAHSCAMWKMSVNAGNINIPWTKMDDTPYVTGTCVTPTSSDSPTIVTLGFQPSYVMVNMPPDGQLYSTANSNSSIAITSTGFILYKTTTTSNASGYLAFK